MDTQPVFGFKETFHHLVGEIAKAVAQRAGETEQQRLARTQAAVNAIMAFLPRDTIEAILAGRCVMFHELIVDSVSHALRGVEDSSRRAARGSIVSLDKAFGNNLARLLEYQSRPAEGQRDMAERGTVVTADAAETIVASEPADTVPAEEPAEEGADRPFAPFLNRAARRAAKQRQRATLRAGAAVARPTPPRGIVGGTA